MGTILQVELKTTPDTPDAGYLQKAADFIHAYILGGSNPPFKGWGFVAL